MQKHARDLIAHPLISGSGILLIASTFGNAGNYVFNLLMGRMLPVSEYGMLLSITAVMGLLLVFQSALTTIIAKFAAKYTASNNENALDALKTAGMKIVIIVALVFFLILLAVSGLMNSFLHITNPLIWILAAVAVSISMFSSYTIGILQGKLNFLYLAGLNILGIISKLVLGVGLVYIGFGVSGGIMAFLAFFSIPFLIALPFVFPKFHKTKKHEEKTLINELKKYSFAFLLATIGIAFIQGGDVILVRHYMSPIASGQYAALSLMGKAIFYLTTPIYFVLFPLIAQKKERKEKLFGTLALATIIIAGCSTLFSFVYFMFPQEIVNIFFPNKLYQVTTQYLGVFSLYILLFSIAYLLNTFFLSSGRTGVWKIDIFVTVVFTILVALFHSNFTQIIIDLFSTSFLLLGLLCIYYKTNVKA